MIQLSFIEGFLSGAHYVVDCNIDHAKYAGDNFTPQRGAEMFLVSLTEKKETFTRQEMELLMEYSAYLETSKVDKYYVADTTVRQIADGLETFYFDPKHQKIKISDAVYLVKKQIQGASSEEIEVLCQWLRSDPDPKKRYYQDKDGKMKSISFF